MNASIFNRAEFEHPADGWYQIEVLGEHFNAQSDVWQIIDQEAGRSIVSAFNSAAAAGTLPQGHEMLIDHEHFSSDPSQETIAYGWLQELQVRDDGIYGRIRWTALGQAAVDGGEYRFFSTEYGPKDLVNLGGEPPRVRPMRLDGLTLTNQPNNMGCKPITNRAWKRPSHPAQTAPPRAAGFAAATRIDRLAAEHRARSGGSVLSSYLAVHNREPRLAALASGRPISAGVNTGARETLEDAASFAGRTVLCLAQSMKMQTLSASLACIKNRFPRLARIQNREAGWDALAEFEPVAHQAYMDIVQGPRDAMPDARWQSFLSLSDGLKAEFPDLGYEGVWQEMKELYPASYIKLLLSFDDLEAQPDMQAPAPKTAWQIFAEKRARIAQAAASEVQASGRNGRGGSQTDRDVVSEALRAL